MVKKLKSKSEFAALCGVSAAAVTKACNGPLKESLVGKRVDINHPLAAKYLKDKTKPQAKPQATGLDPLYEQAILACNPPARFSITNIRKVLGVGAGRATRIHGSMKANGISYPLKPEQLADASSNSAPPAPKNTSSKQAKKEASLAKLNSALAPGAADKPALSGEHGLIEIPEDIKIFLDMTLRQIIAKFGTETAFNDYLSATQKIEVINEKRLKNAQTEGELISRSLVKGAIIDKINGLFVRLLTDGVKTISSQAHEIANASGGVEEVEAMVEDHLSSLIRPTKSKIGRALINA